jgi:energy-coupling factor transporter ATP-binding protein EcfA2
VIEHDLPLVTQISDRMVAMELGGVIAHGGPREVVNDQRVVASYLAASDEVLTRSGDVVRGFVNETLERVAKGQGKERTVNGGTRTKQQQRIKT